MLQHDITNNKYYFYGKEITAERYAEIREIMDNIPKAEKGYYYILTEDLEWELRKMPDPDPEEETDDSEALSILLGGAT